MSKIINAIIIGLLGGGCFTVGIYYATLEFENQVQVWDSNYQIITDKVYAFEEVSDPETIRHYVKELNKILDDIKYLGKMVESGQLADEALTEFFNSYQNKLDNLNERVVVLALETQGMLSEISGEVKSDLRTNKVELENKLKSESDSVRKEIGKLYDKTDELYKELKQVSILLDKAKETFIGKQVFK
jgi:uncharacterized coiled-coil DUF342 family protein